MLRNRIKLICNYITNCINWLELMFNCETVALYDQFNNISYPKICRVHSKINFKQGSKNIWTRLTAVLTILINITIVKE